jgi:hypothetical protein
VHADLVGAAGLEAQPHQRRAEPQGRRSNLPVRDRRLAARHLRREPLAIDRVAPVEGADRARRRRAAPCRHREVGALDLALVLPGRGQRGQGGLVLGHHHHARGVAIEPVDDAGAQLAADAAEVVDVGEEPWTSVPVA